MELEAFAGFCSKLTLEQGRRFELEPFQRTLLADYFAGVRESLVLIPKKNGKTTLMAALALYHLMTTDDPECVIGAASRKQASIMWDQAEGFILRSEGLRKRLDPKGGYKEIRKRGDLPGRAQVVAADVSTADGVIPTLALVDELGRHKKPDLYGVFRDGLGPRDGQLVSISTAGEHEATPLGVIRAAARKLPSTREGKYRHSVADDHSFAMHEWALDEDDDLDDMELVKQVNPASWQTTKLLAQRHDSPSMRPHEWARMACGIWLAAELRWMNGPDWYERETDDELEYGDRITLGFDGGRYHDATALVGCRLSDGLVQLLDVWEHPGGAEEWETPQGSVDAAIAQAMDDYRVVRGYFDPPLWQSEIESWSRDYGEESVMRYHTNRSRFLAAVERFRTDHSAGKIPHSSDDRLTRHVLSAQLKESRGGFILVKGRAWDDFIDAAVAMVLAYEARADALAGGVSDKKKGYAFY